MRRFLPPYIMSLQGHQKEKLFNRIALTPWKSEEHAAYIARELASIRAEKDGEAKASRIEAEYKRKEAEDMAVAEETIKKDAEAAVAALEAKVQKVVVIAPDTTAPTSEESSEAPVEPPKKKRGRPSKNSPTI